jgi:hypothetical protein
MSTAANWCAELERKRQLALEALAALSACARSCPAPATAADLAVLLALRERLADLPARGCGPAELDAGQRHAAAPFEEAMTRLRADLGKYGGGLVGRIEHYAACLLPEGYGLLDPAALTWRPYEPGAGLPPCLVSEIDTAPPAWRAVLPDAADFLEVFLGRAAVALEVPLEPSTAPYIDRDRLPPPLVPQHGLPRWVSAAAVAASTRKYRRQQLADRAARQAREADQGHQEVLKLHRQAQRSDRDLPQWYAEDLRGR